MCRGNLGAAMSTEKFPFEGYFPIVEILRKCIRVIVRRDIVKAERIERELTNLQRTIIILRDIGTSEENIYDYAIKVMHNVLGLNIEEFTNPLQKSGVSEEKLQRILAMSDAFEIIVEYSRKGLLIDAEDQKDRGEKERRKCKRLEKTSIILEYQNDDRWYQGVACDISLLGAQIKSYNGLIPSNTTKIKLEKLESVIVGNVMWLHPQEKKFGLQFTQSLPVTQNQLSLMYPSQ